MDPKAIVLRKVAALERIDSGLARLVSQFKFDAGLCSQLRRSYADPDLADMLRLEQVAELISTLVEAAAQALKLRGLQGLPDGRDDEASRKKGD